MVLPYARVIAVDWSGRREDAQQSIWLAEFAHGRVQRLESGRNRDQIIDELAHVGETSERVLVGLDFAFAMPAWFVEQYSRDSRHFREVVARHGEDWIATSPSPFWGRPGCRRPDHGYPDHRQTELAFVRHGLRRPASVFQIGGAGSVGTGSLRGIPLLSRLAAAGYAIWPFDRVANRTVVEIYPRCFTGPVVKTRREARSTLLRELERFIPDGLARVAAESEDAFDAVVSVIGMASAAIEPASWIVPEPAPAATEGWIWPSLEGWRRDHMAAMVAGGELAIGSIDDGRGHGKRTATTASTPR